MLDAYSCQMEKEFCQMPGIQLQDLELHLFSLVDGLCRTFKICEDEASTGSGSIYTPASRAGTSAELGISRQDLSSI